MTVTSYEDTKASLLDAALGHVPFDGWSDATFRAAAQDVGVELTLARAICPRGAVDLAIADDLTSFNKQVFHARWSRKQQCSRIPAACTLDTMHIPDGNVSAFAGHKAPAIGTVQHICPASGCNLQRFTGRHRISTVCDPLQQHGLTRLGHQIAAVIAGRAINAKTNRYTVIAHCAYRSDARPKATIRTGAMGHARSTACEQINFCAI